MNARPLVLRLRAAVTFAGVAVLAGACATRQPAPVVDRTPTPPAVRPVAPAAPVAPADAREPRTYTVKRGDTLVGIALQFGLDYRELAAWNNIENPNVIRVGQVLVLSAPGSQPPATPAVGGTVAMPLRSAEPSVSRPPANTETRKVEPRAQRLPYSERNLAQLSSAESPFAPAAGAAAAPAGASAPASAVAPPPVPPVARPSGSEVTAAPGSAAPPAVAAKPVPGEGIDWLWPAKGKVIATFTDANKGIGIAGAKGTPVLAAAAGRVVYVGQGLRGYGKLVILRHSEQWLSAYAHNDQILVKEQQEVARGQKIAEMGATDSDQVKLHFEIRRQGRPVDPMKLLPAP